MPELPEVETIRTSLEPALLGRRVEKLEVQCRSLRIPVAENFEASLQGRTICGLRRRGKYLLIDIDSPQCWIFHLGMSGRLLHHAAEFSEAPAKHDHVVATFAAGAGSLVFNDPRRFGLTVLAAEDDCRFLQTMGPEPLDEEALTLDYLWALRKRTRRNVKDVLMDQRVVAGLGNIYVSEILFLAGIRPRHRFDRLSRSRVERLLVAIRTIIEEAIEHRGSTVSDFLDGIGRRGGYQWRHRVYDRAGQPCPDCGVAIKTVVIAQRSSFYCPDCQS
jgi:formamidopyrimidine-DNA glycosylase